MDGSNPEKDMWVSNWELNLKSKDSKARKFTQTKSAPSIPMVKPPILLISQPLCLTLCRLPAMPPPQPSVTASRTPLPPHHHHFSSLALCAFV